MASILKSQAAFEERAKECGLAQAELDVLVRKGLTSLSLLAFSVSTPGEVPQEAELRSILDPTDPTTVPLRALSALRRLMFEAQTLSIAQLKSSIEGEGERKAELAPAERANRLADQRKRLIGLSLTGPLENAFSNYTYVAQVVDQDCLSYLEPHRFLTRAMEVNREKPGKLNMEIFMRFPFFTICSLLLSRMSIEKHGHLNDMDASASAESHEMDDSSSYEEVVVEETPPAPSCPADVVDQRDLRASEERLKSQLSQIAEDLAAIIFQVHMLQESFHIFRTETSERLSILEGRATDIEAAFEELHQACSRPSEP
ncbi:unnamed protein product [Symbiodinium sp. CCMP2592]|nr:unnamed protein product [Symbiodinium sp. CCMP2592]